MAIKTVLGHPGAGKNYYLLRRLPFCRSSRISSFFWRNIPQITAMAAMTITGMAHAATTSTVSSWSSICVPSDLQGSGQKLAAVILLLMVLNFALNFLALILRDLVIAWIDRRVARGAK